jgi:hypothetical protein
MKINRKTAKPTNVNFSMKKLEEILDLYLVKKAPSIPTNIKEIIVKFFPYIALVALILSLPSFLGILGLASLFLIATLILDIIALPGLFARKYNGWKYLYYASLINAIYALVRFDLGSLIIGTTLSLYILFQVKSYYQN